MGVISCIFRPSNSSLLQLSSVTELLLLGGGGEREGEQR